MHDEFLNIAARIAERAVDDGLTVSELNDLVASSRDEVNCYPGNPSSACCPLAYFIALHGRMAKGKGHYNFAQIMEELVRHVQGRCPGTTRQAVIITNAWWHDHHEKWRANLETIQRSGIVIEAYLIVNERVSPLAL